MLRRAFLILLVLGGGTAGAAWFLAGREAGPAIEVKSPAKFIGQAGSLELFVDAPGGRLTRLTATLTQGDQTIPVFALDGPPGDAAEVKQAVVRSAVGDPPARQEGAAGAGAREGHADRDRRPAGALRLPRGGQHRHPRPRGAPRSAADCRRLAAPLPQPRRLGVRRAARHAARRRGRRPGRRPVVRRVPGQRGRPHRSGAARWRSSPCPTTRTPPSPVTVFARDEAGNEATARMDRQPFPKRFQRSRIPIDQALPRPRRAGHRLEHAVARPRRERRRRPAAGVPDHQPRPAPAEQPGDRGAGGEDRARDAVAGVVRAARQHPGGVAVRRSPHLLLRRQGNRPADAPRLRPRLDPAGAGDRRRIAAWSCTRPISASTATAWSSITDWACSRSTRTCRRWT